MASPRAAFDIPADPRDRTGPRLRGAFTAPPAQTLLATLVADVPRVVAHAEALARAGAWVIGGVRYEGAFHALHATAQGIANDKRANAAHLDRTDLFARRAAEWAHSLEQARLELAQGDAQRQAYTEQQAHTRLQLGLAQTSLAQARSLYDQLGKRFTNAQLYQWLNGQLSTFYYQAYDSSLSLCLAAEAVICVGDNDHLLKVANTYGLPIYHVD